MDNKLAKVVGSATVAAKLDRAGLGLPTSIRKASDTKLAQAGLTQNEIAAVRAKLPRRA